MNKCVEMLLESEIQFESISLCKSVHSVRDVEIACGCSSEEVIKTLIFIGRYPVMAILPGNKKADVAKIKKLVDESSLRMATRDEVVSITGYTVGSVTPFGIDSSVIQLADHSIANLSNLILGSGKSDLLIRLTYSEFERIFQGELASISIDG